MPPTFTENMTLKNCPICNGQTEMNGSGGLDCHFCGHSFISETVPCELCGDPTPMTGTKRCDRCWELERRIKSDPELAKRIFLQLNS
jgi:hypothetical protein